MVRIRIECNNDEDMKALYYTLKSRAKVKNVQMVLDSSGRMNTGYFVEFEGGYPDAQG